MTKSIFRVFLAMHVFLYRLTSGKFLGKIQNMPVLLLTTTGRKTGKKRTTPLGYFEDNGRYVIIGSNAGANTHPGWFYNLKGHSQATIQVKDKQLEVSAEIAGPGERERLWARLMELAPSYGNYTKNTTREIPIVTLNPEKS